MCKSMISVFNGIDLFILYHLKKVFLKICMFQNGFVSYFFWKRCFWTFQSVWVWFRSFVMLPPLPLSYSLYPFPLGVSTTPLTNPILRPPISPRYFNQFCTNNFFRVNHINHFPLRGLTADGCPLKRTFWRIMALFFKIQTSSFLHCCRAAQFSAAPALTLQKWNGSGSLFLYHLFWFF